MQHASRPELLLKFGILRLVLVFRFFLRVQVIEVPEELVEAVLRR
jgi:hypothetical protein